MISTNLKFIIVIRSSWKEKTSQNSKIKIKKEIKLNKKNKMIDHSDKVIKIDKILKYSSQDKTDKILKYSNQDKTRVGFCQNRILIEPSGKMWGGEYTHYIEVVVEDVECTHYIEVVVEDVVDIHCTEVVGGGGLVSEVVKVEVDHHGHRGHHGYYCQYDRHDCCQKKLALYWGQLEDHELSGYVGLLTLVAKRDTNSLVEAQVLLFGMVNQFGWGSCRSILSCASKGRTCHTSTG